MNIAAVVIAGGRSSRMGHEKAFLRVGGATIIEQILARVGPQVMAVAINVNDSGSRLHDLGPPIVSDVIAVGTPLAGIHAGLSWSRQNGFEALLTVPSDCPFLPPDLVTRLTREGPGATVAASGDQVHHLTGLWPVGLLDDLETAVSKHGVRRVKDWAKFSGARAVYWPSTPYDPFFNVNTPDDLAEADRIAAEFAP